MPTQASNRGRQRSQQFECGTCHRRFGSRKALQDHLRSLPNHSKEKPSRTYPNLHGDIVRSTTGVLGPLRFNHNIDDSNTDNEYSTNISGKFKCETPSCRTDGWSSGVVSIVIRQYPDSTYNAIVYNQSCKACNNLGVLEIDIESYVQRVSYRLKKWAGIRMEPPPYSLKEGPPHQSALCEGCKRGYCRQRGGAGV
ncbi:hypothetical protein FH972_025108 [Carpinus fangiana]|uniref:C2H2-type domain-containing protein n=1 Tax=Carpinus fangiana TaxID=176857 RepID=A0A5N6L0D7_9ROSI|nr:hypothetical protein FH972_025108 [Carpinus fangiana]